MPTARVPRARLGIYSTPPNVRDMDGRLTEKKLINATIDALTMHCGGYEHVTKPMSMLIESAAISCFRLHALLKRFEEGTNTPDHDRVLVAQQNTLRATLTSIGLQRPEQVMPTLSEYIASKKRGAA